MLLLLRNLSHVFLFLLLHSKETLCDTFEIHRKDESNSESNLCSTFALSSYIPSSYSSIYITHLSSLTQEASFVLQSCARPIFQNENPWKCEEKLCEDSPNVFFTYSKEKTEELYFPANSSFPLNPQEFPFLVLQVKPESQILDVGVKFTYVKEPTSRSVGIYHFYRSSNDISSINCRIRSKIFPFATRFSNLKDVLSVYDVSEKKRYEVLSTPSISSFDYIFFPTSLSYSPDDYFVVNCALERKNSNCEVSILYTSESSKAENLHCMDEEMTGLTIKSSRKKGNLESVDVVNYFNISIPGALATQNDDYRCVSFDVSQLNEGGSLYLTGFEASANSERAHHVILSHCKIPTEKPGKIFQCLHHGMCYGESRILFAWAKNAQPAVLPHDVGFELFESDYLVLQVHYKHPLETPDYTGLHISFTTQRPSYIAGMLLLMRTDLTIPPNTNATHGDINCRIDTESPLHIFAFRTHAHDLGAVISGYKFSKNSTIGIEVARGDPQRPQAFYPLRNEIVVQNGDSLAARCTYDSSKKNKVTYIGSTANDEMCNLYLMYYSKSKDDSFRVCMNEYNASLKNYLPLDSDVSLDEILSRRRAKALIGSKPLVPVANWPPDETISQIGQLSGISLDVYGNPVIFHRGDRLWKIGTFSNANVYTGDQKSPITQNTILTLNSSGHVINAWGSHLFYMPHMITIDKQNHVWVTDVALHQVFKFGPYGGSTHKPLIEMGQRFQPGSDDRHYCQPTSVAVSDDGKTFFVADGYCNSRIIKYNLHVDETGYHKVSISQLLHWGEANGAGFSSTLNPYALNIPHGLALIEKLKLICVADRQNARVQCFDTENGRFIKSYKPSEFGSSIYSVAYTPAFNGLLLALGGSEPFGLLTGKKSRVYVLDINTTDLLITFGENIISNPHDLTVSENGSTVYTVELNPFKITKFTNDEISSSQSHSSGTTVSPSQNPGIVFTDYLPTSGIALGIGLGSGLISLLLVCCALLSKYRKRGRGSMASSHDKKKRIDLGDLLGRSKDGFHQVKTKEEDDVLMSSSDESDEFISSPLNT